MKRRAEVGLRACDRADKAAATRKRGAPAEGQPAPADTPRVAGFAFLATFLRLLSETHPADKLAPGVVMSRLPNGRWYVSVCRYPVGSKEVVCNLQDRTLTRAIRDVATLWLGKYRPKVTEGGSRRAPAEVGGRTRSGDQVGA